jgi:putative PEP-CTERM system histidine kinase
LSPFAYTSPAVWSFGLALAALGGFAAQLALGWRGGARASLLVGAVAASTVWAAIGLAYAGWGSDALWLAWRVADVVRSAAWSAFLLLLLAIGHSRSGAPARRHLPILVAAAVLAAVALVWAFPGDSMRAAGIGIGNVRLGYALSLGLAVFGLVCVEQLLRNTPPELRWGVKPLCVGLAGVYAFDLFLYADGVLFGRLDPVVWSAHGAVQACVIPFIAVSTVRNREWTVDIAVSRQVVFHTTALLGSGLYLLAVAAVGYYIRYFGGTWGAAVQVALLFAATLLLGALVTSGTFRSKLRVFVTKNFFSYRYDYREEWLRFTNLLVAGSDAQTSIQERAVRALADLVESPAGALWLKRERSFRQVARWNAPEIVEAEPFDGAVAGFLARTGWVIDLREQARRGPRAVDLEAPRWLGAWTEAWLVVPLVAAEDLVGFVVLANPRVAVELDWEILDLLKTAGRQAASYLGQIEASAALLETEKFAAFNRMSAFVVHDLKNLVAQLSLMLKNAERHSDNPEFQRDMLETVRHVVERMNGLLLQLRLGTNPVENAKPVDVAAVVRRVGQAKRLVRPGLAVEAVSPVFGLGHEDRLEHVVGHLVQNAIDATHAEGRVAVRVADDGQHAVVEVEDDGEGMTREFVQTRLFKPFQTTKREGMGIGTYESHQYVTALGGTIAVDSAPGRGTKVRLLLPRAGLEPRAANDLREVA